MGVFAALLEGKGLDVPSVLNGVETTLVDRLLTEKGYGPGELLSVVWERDGIALTDAPRFLRARLQDALSRPSQAVRAQSDPDVQRRAEEAAEDARAAEQERRADQVWEAMSDQDRENAIAHGREETHPTASVSAIRRLARLWALENFGLDGARLTEEATARDARSQEER